MERPCMKATEALQAARSFNVQINLCGDNLALDAPEAPPERVLDALRENKPQIVAILRASIRPAGCAQRRCVACRCRRRCPTRLLGCYNKAGLPMLIGHAWAALPMHSEGRLAICST
jgi:hypothetical protein